MKLDNPFNKLIEEKGNKRIADLLAPHLKDIERAMESGLSHTEILGVLSELGIHLTLGTFRTSLYRMRKAGSKVDTNITPVKSPAINQATQMPDTKTKSNPTQNKAGFDLVVVKKEEKIPFTWRELRKEVIDF